MNRFLLLFLWLNIPCFLLAQNCGLEEIEPIPFSDTLKIDLEVFEVVNDDLSDINQAVCSVDIGFLCNEINSLEIWLVSPNLDTVQLVGPKTIGTGFGSLGASWDVRFLNDSINATASPDFPFDQYFDNRLNSFPANNYNGSYFPNAGSLADFNTGTVNGTWQLIAHYEPTFLLVDGSAVFKMKINFCDARGYNCCFANAGSLRNVAPQNACEGDPALQFTISPEFDGMEADTNVYDYTFAIGKDSILYAFDSLPDFSSYPPGTYQLCGFSYQSDQRDSFPAIDGLFRIDTFANQLQSLLPPMCGQITDTCVTIVIRPTSDTTFLGNQLLCGSDSLIIAGQKLDSTGLYFIQTTNVSGCDSIIQVDLNVQPIQRDTLLETECPGATHIAATGATLDTTGYYEFRYTSSITGCDSIVVIDFRRLEIDAQVSQTGTDLSCSTPTITLDASGSSAFGTISYKWEIPPFGAEVGRDSILIVTEPGDYFLQLSTRVGAKSCADARFGPITITSSAQPPVVDILAPELLTCTDTTVSLQANVSPLVGNYSYQWSTTDGNILTNPDSSLLQVNEIGTYQVIVTNLDSGCQDTSFTQVLSDTIIPVLTGVNDTILTCDPGSLRLNVSPFDNSRSYNYQWTAQRGLPIDDANTASPLINFADTFIVAFTDLQNGCQSQDSLVVSLDTLTPAAVIAPVSLLDCQVREFDLDASSSDQGPSILIDWQTSNGGNISANGTSLQPTINAGGIYTLTVRDTLNGCSSQASVSVTDTSEVLFAEVIQSTDISCINPEVVLSPGNSSTGPNISYFWTDLDQGLFSSIEMDSVIINQGGRYQLIVQNTFSNCLEVATFTASLDTISPVINAGPDQELTCSQPILTLSGTANSNNSPTIYSWQGPCIVGDPNQQSIQVDCEGTYIYQATNTQNGCITSDTVFVSTNPTTPRVVIADTFRLDCATGNVSLDASQSSGGRVEWFFNNFAIGSVNDNITVSRTGTYTVRVINDTLACSAEKDIFVILDCTPEIVLNNIETLNCQNDSILLDASSSIGESLAFSWSGPNNGCILSNNTLAQVYVNCPGSYQVIARNTFFDQSDTLLIEVQEDIDFPLIDLGPDLTLTCFDPVLNLDATNPANDTGLVYNWKTEFGLTFADTSVLSIDARGTYILEIENPRNSCSSSDTIMVQGLETPVFEIKAPEVITCADSLIELSALIFSDSNNLTYSWSGLDSQLIDAPTQSTIMVDQTGDYVLTLSNPTNGCVSSDTINVTRNQVLPQVSAGIDQTFNCDSDQLTLTGNAMSQSTDIEIRWLSRQPNDIISGNESLSITVQDTGTFQLLVVDLENGCSALDTVEVLPPPLLPPLPIIQDQSISCAQISLNLDAGFAPRDSFTFTWKGITDQGTTISKQEGSMLEVDAPGFYTFELKNTFTNCSDSLTVRINDNRIDPDFVIAPPETLSCSQTEVTLALAFPLDSNRYELSWSGPNTQVNGNLAQVNEPGFYYLSVTDMENGCSSTDSVLVTQSIEVPAINLPAAPLLTCSEDTLILSASAAPNTVPFWSGPVGGIVGDSVLFDVQVRLPGIYVLSITDTLTGCTNGSALTIEDGRIAPTLVLDTSQFILGCDQPTINIDASSASTESGAIPVFSWLGIGISSNEPTIEVDLPQTLQLNILDTGNGCSIDLSVPVRQDQELPQFQLTSDGPLGCGKSQSLLEAQFINFMPSFELAWMDESGNTIGTQSNINVSQEGTYQLVVTNPMNACSNKQEISVGLNDLIPIIALEVDTVLDCGIEEVLITANSSNYDLANLTLNWSSNGGQILNELPNGISVGEAGLYTLNVLNQASGCEQTAEISVFRNGRTINNANFLLNQTSCDETGSGSLLVNQVDGGDAPFIYSFNGGDFQTSNGFNFTQAGTFQLKIQDSNGCEWDSLVIIESPDIPMLDLGDDISITAGEEILLNATADADAFAQLDWISNNTIIASNTNMITVNPMISSAYTIRGSTLDGCTFEDVIQVFVEEAPIAYLPNAFSPDNDGINDLFIPGFADQVIEITRFTIFDRWGNTVFQSINRNPSDLEAGWDGRLNKEPQPSGVYVFWIELKLENGEERRLKGEVLLIR
ncbi:MAG: hypothetical protein Sapg2KO_43530 [Saprospiraceae bacterium]